MPSRRLDDRIRELCRQVLRADGADLEDALSELQSATHEHVYLRRVAVHERDGQPERRAYRIK